MPTFKITQEQKDEYSTKGFIRIKKAINPELLSRLQSLSEKFEDNIINEYKNGRITPGACISQNADVVYLFRFDNIHSVDWNTVLDLLSSPSVMAISSDFR